jgi:SAM-dependent methyltransferase
MLLVTLSMASSSAEMSSSLDEFRASLYWAWERLAAIEHHGDAKASLAPAESVNFSHCLSIAAVRAADDVTLGKAENIEGALNVFHWIDGCVLAIRALGTGVEWLKPWLARAEVQVRNLGAMSRQGGVALVDLITAGQQVRTTCVDGADLVSARAGDFEALWENWALAITTHPSYLAALSVRSARHDQRWSYRELDASAKALSAQMTAPPELVMDCLLGSQPLPFGPSDDRELGCGRHGYAHSSAAAVMGALEALELRRGDRFYDLGSGLGAPTILAALESHARCRGVEIHESYVVRARATAEAYALPPSMFVVGDVLDVDWSDGNRFYMFNPFPSRTLEAVSERLRLIAELEPIRVACFHGSLGRGFNVIARYGAVTVFEAR